MNRLRELQSWRQFFRNQKAKHLRTHRKYKEMWGEEDSMARFMEGFAAGYTSPISVMDTLIQQEEARDGNA